MLCGKQRRLCVTVSGTLGKMKTIRQRRSEINKSHNRVAVRRTWAGILQDRWSDVDASGSNPKFGLRKKELTFRGCVSKSDLSLFVCKVAANVSGCSRQRAQCYSSVFTSLNFWDEAGGPGVFPGSPRCSFLLRELAVDIKSTDVGKRRKMWTFGNKRWRSLPDNRIVCCVWIVISSTEFKSRISLRLYFWHTTLKFVAGWPSDQFRAWAFTSGGFRLIKNHIHPVVYSLSPRNPEACFIHYFLHLPEQQSDMFTLQSTKDCSELADRTSDGDGSCVLHR